MSRFSNLGGSSGGGRFGGGGGHFGGGFKPPIPPLPRGGGFNALQSCALGCIALVAIFCLCGLVAGAQVIGFLQQVGRLLGLG